MNPKLLIEQIQEKILSSNREFVLDSLAGAIDRLQKVFPRYNSCIMEFIQNSDDAKSNKLMIDIKKNRLIIYNDGRVFSQEDVTSICKIGRSAKDAREYIGYLGVGFKSAFLISNSVKIRSGEFSFSFDKYYWNEEEKIPWQIIPIWNENPFEIEYKEYSTIFSLLFKDPSVVKILNEEVKPDVLNNRVLLFLRNINEIIIKQCDYKRKFTKTKIYESQDYEIYEIEEIINDEDVRKDKWLIFRSVCNVPEHVRNDILTKEWDRENVLAREVLVAFKLDQNDELVPEKMATAHSGVFSFLPIKEVPSGLNFLIQADFLTTPGRSDLARECIWNEWIASEIFNLLIKKCIPTFKNHTVWRLNFTTILYSKFGGHPIFQNNIKTPLENYLLQNPVLLNTEENFSKFDEVIKIPETISDLITKTDFELLFPNKKLLHPDCKPADIFDIYKLPEDLYEFLKKSEFRSLCKNKTKDINWFKQLYSKLLKVYTLDYFKKQYPNTRTKYYEKYQIFWYHNIYSSNIEIVLTDNYELTTFRDLYINPQKLTVPSLLKSEIKIVHPEIEASQEFNNIISRIRYSYSFNTDSLFCILQEKDINAALHKMKINTLTPEKWKIMNSNEKINEIKMLKDLWVRKVDLRNFDFLTLKSQKGEWVKPDKLILPSEYFPEHNLSILLSKNLLDFELDLVCLDFIKDLNRDEIINWRDFFKYLGVDTRVKNEKIKFVERIAVILAMKFEINNGRTPRELGESENMGYDIISKSENEIRYIEVKGRSEPEPEIHLTANELQFLLSNTDNYFIYIVNDALKNPVLQIIKGKNLLDLEGTKISYSYERWKEKVIEKFMP